MEDRHFVDEYSVFSEKKRFSAQIIDFGNDTPLPILHGHLKGSHYICAEAGVPFTVYIYIYIFIR